MPRIEALTPDQLAEESKATLNALTESLGFTPNMLASFAKSPIAFNAWAALLNPRPNDLALLNHN